MPMNTFASQKEVLFITYDDVIKTTKLLILKKLLTPEYRQNYEDFIDYSIIDNKTDEELLSIIFSATDKNILKFLSKSSFDFDVTYTDLYLNYENIIPESTLLSFGQSIHILLKQKFLDKIYIYTPHFDESVYKDIYDVYGSTNIIYVYGEFETIIRSITKDTNIKITSFVLNDIELVNKLIELNVVAYTNILICNGGWNYKLNKNNVPVLKLDNSEKLSKENIFKIGVFDSDK